MHVNVSEKVEALADLISKQQGERHKKSWPDIPEDHLHRYTFVHIRPGKKYIKIDLDTSGKYMVDNETGEIFGIKGYGKIHRGHAYGTLDTINEWYWGDYTAVKVVTA